MPKRLSFVTPIAYDYKRALDAIDAYYPIADEIVLGLDQARISWSRKSFPFDNDDFSASIKVIDKENKIRVIEDNFHARSNPMDNDTQERQRLADCCADDHWVVQVDSDEIILNPETFADWMRSHAKIENSIRGEFITVFKVFGDSALIVKRPKRTMIHVASIKGVPFTMGRNTEQPPQVSPLVVFHNSWGRTREDLWMKLENWGHSADFDIAAYLKMWDSVTLDNFPNFTNIHPLYGPNWPGLELVDLKQYRARAASIRMRR